MDVSGGGSGFDGVPPGFVVNGCAAPTGGFFGVDHVSVPDTSVTERVTFTRRRSKSKSCTRGAAISPYRSSVYARKYTPTRSVPWHRLAGLGRINEPQSQPDPRCERRFELIGRRSLKVQRLADSDGTAQDSSIVRRV
ncbi:hypothetical protein [Tsukamurella sp. NPDC003166]|uniref:hypothetical protein n=1 Tax=Tsukamurella sp. NPDC003166 TaxID=3154444 RepID=UPI0033B33BB6